MSHAPRPAPARLALIIGLLVHGAAQGAVVQWNDPAGGSFTDTANWSPAQRPQEADTILFNLGAPANAPYVVTGFEGGVNRLVVGQDTVRFDFDQTRRLRLLSRALAAPGLVVGELAGQHGILQLFDGGLLLGEHGTIGATAGSSGEVQVDASRLELAGSLSLGASAANRLTLSNGAVVQAGTVSMKAGTLSAQGSKLEIAGAFEMGGSVSTALDIGQGTLLTTGDTTFDPRGANFFEITTFADVAGSGTRWDIRGRLVMRENGMWAVHVRDGASLRTGEAVLDGSSASGSAASTLLVEGAGTDWTASGAVDVGKLGWGALSVQAGALARAPSARLGVEAGSLGIVSVAGMNSRVEFSEKLEVGLLGRGILRMRSGGGITAGELVMGKNSQAGILQPGSLLDIVGDGSLDGVLELSPGGGAKFGGNVTLGSESAASAIVRITGTGSNLTVGGTLHVGDLGSADMTLSAGGTAASDFANLGTQAGSNGNVSVSGTDSHWQIAEELRVGAAGSGTLTILDGGQVTSRVSRLAAFGTGVGEARVAGRGSVWRNSEFLTVAREGQADLLIEDGGVVESAGGFVGSGARDARGTVTIEGRDSAWRVAGNLHLGGPGSATGAFDLIGGVGGIGSVTVRDGGLLEVTEGLRIRETSTLRLAGGTLSLEQLDNLGSFLFDAGTLRVTASDFRVGQRGGLPGFFEHTLTLRGDRHLQVVDATGVVDSTGTLNLFDGASFSAPGGRTTGSLLVDDATLRFDTMDLVHNGSLIVRAGGVLEVGRDFLIGEATTRHGTVDVDGAGSRVNVGRDLTVGVNSSGTVTLTDGAVLDVGGNGEIAGEAGSQGRVALSGARTQWTNALDLAVGLRGSGELEIADGATVDSKTNALIGHQAGALGDALVTGAGSEWQIASTLYVGFQGDGELTVANGAKVAAQSLGLIANRAGSRGRVTVTGPGSELSVGASLFVGDADDGAMTVSDGATVTTQGNGRLGFHIGANGRVLVTGEDSAWTIGNSLFVANEGLGELVVADGATVTTENNNDTWVGFDAGSTGTLELTGTGSRLTTDQFVVGNRGNGQLRVLDGALISSGNSWIGFDAPSDSSARIAGGGEWQVATVLSVATFGKALLDISDGGVVRSADAYVANGTTGRGTVNIEGNGSAWFTAGDFWLGGNEDGESGGVGELTLRDDGLLEVGGLLRVFDKSSLFLAGGMLRVGSLDLGGKFEFESGTLQVTGSDLRVGRDHGIPGFFDASLNLFGDKHVEVVDGDAAVDSTGQIAIANGASFKARAGNNDGRIFVDRGTLHFTAASVNTGAIDASDATLRFDGGLRNEKSLRLRNGTVATASGLEIDSEGSVFVTDANTSLDVSGNADVAGLLNLEAGGLVAVGGTTTIQGDGRVHLDGGTLRTRAFDTAGRFDFTKGLLDLTGGILFVRPGGGVPGWFDTRLVLGPQQRLNISRGALQISEGGEVVVDGAGAGINVFSSVLLGRGGGHGKLTIANGGFISNGLVGFVGDTAGSSGEVTVRGANTRWTSADDVVIGNFGAGTLDVLEGAFVRSADLFVGGNAGSSGRARVSGTGTTVDVVGKLFVGLADEGLLEITDGGTLKASSEGVLGNAATGAAVLKVSGADALLDIAGPLTIGNAGKGELTIEAGGRVRNAVGTLGALTTGRGDVFVRGADSVWDNASDLFIGDSGAGTLTIEDGGEVLNLGAELGNQAGGRGKAIVRGAGSSWTSRQVLLVGDRGAGSLLIEDGATVSNGSVGFIGNVLGSAGDVTVTGAGSLWDSGGPLVIGNAGNGQLHVLDGARVEAPALLMGAAAHGSVLIDGALSTLAIAELAEIGYATTGSVTARDGGLLEVGSDLLLGSNQSGRGQVLIEGVDSRGAVARDVLVGALGTGELAIDAGGLLEVGRDLLLGSSASGKGELRVEGETSRVDVQREFTVAVSGNGSALVAGGATLDVAGNGEIAGESGSKGRVVLRGAGTRWDNAFDIAVGLRGNGELEIADGATVAAHTNALIGHQRGARGDALVTGAGSKWTIASTLFVGFHGDGALTVENGAALSVSSEAVLGDAAGSSGRARVTGRDSMWTTGGSLVVGSRGTGEMTVADGAELKSEGFTAFFIGDFAGSNGTLDVLGAGTRATANQILVGYAGNGTLRGFDGAALLSTGLLMGVQAGATGTLELSGVGTRATSNSVGVGYQGNGTLRLLDGAALISERGRVGDSFGGSGTALVDGGEWNSREFLVIADIGTGSLNIVGGGVARTQTSLVAFSPSGRGDAIVEGKGSAWITSGQFLLGGRGSTFVAGSGAVTVRDGGLLEVGDVMRVFDRSSLVLDGGTLRVGQLDVRGSFDFESGTLALTASDLRIGRDQGIPGFFDATLHLAGDQHVEVVNGDASLDADGQLVITDGASFKADNGNNEGAITVERGTLAFAAASVNAGLIDARDATLNFDGGLRNNLALRLADSRVNGLLDNQGTITLDGTNVFTGALSGAGFYAGDGTAQLEGSLNPGNSPGIMRFDGDVVLGASHALTIELAGLTPGTAYDQLQVGGTLTLGGTLDIELLDGYAPLLGDTFDIAIAAFIDGEFASRLLPTLAPDLRWDARRLTDTLGRQLYRLEVSAVPVPGAVWLMGSACAIVVLRVRRR